MSKKKSNVSVYHLSATENTLRQMPKFNPYQTGHGVIGDTKYNRRKEKKSYENFSQRICNEISPSII